jgi:hypothetical protein
MSKFLSLVLFSVFSIFSLSAQNEIWTESSSTDFRAPLKERVTNPVIYRTVALNTEAFLQIASTAPSRFSTNVSEN